MKKPLKINYAINKPVSEVWDGIINPAIIKQYFFGTEVISDWKKGSTITYKATWEGKTYINKGNVLDIIPEKFLSTNYWSSFWGKPDSLENYVVYNYELNSHGENTQLTLVINDEFESQEKRVESLQNWDLIISGMKKVLEEK